MTQKEMQDFVEANVHLQGNEGAINISPLLLAIIDKLFADPGTGSTAMVLEIGQEGDQDGTRTRYELTTQQEVINGYIDEIAEEPVNARLYVQDGNALIQFTHVENNGTSVFAYSFANDGLFGLSLSKTAGQSYFYHDELSAAIAEVTQSEIDGYNNLIHATYDHSDNKFNVVVGTTSLDLTPAEMLVIIPEYNKVANNTDYTAMWANSVAKYIFCHEWYSGFSEITFDAAFKNCENLILVDLNKEEIASDGIDYMFEGCSRLEQVTGIIDVTDTTTINTPFKGCEVLHTFKIKGLGVNIDISDSPNLTAETMEYLITNANQSRTFTITVHSDVNNNINNNTLWSDVKTALEANTKITVTPKA